LHRLSKYRWLSGTFAIAVTLASASAQEATYALVSIEQRGDSGTACSSTGMLTTAVEQRLQRHLFVPPSQADLKVTTTFTRISSDWVADIDLYSAQGKPLGHRKITSTSRECSGLDDSLALVIALMVDLTKAELTSLGSPSGAVPSDRATEVRVPAPQGSSNSWSSVLSLGAVASRGQMPRRAGPLQLSDPRS